MVANHRIAIDISKLVQQLYIYIKLQFEGFKKEVQRSIR